MISVCQVWKKRNATKDKLIGLKISYDFLYYILYYMNPIHMALMTQDLTNFQVHQDKLRLTQVQPTVKWRCGAVERLDCAAFEWRSKRRIVLIIPDTKDRRRVYTSKVKGGYTHHQGAKGSYFSADISLFPSCLDEIHHLACSIYNLI